MNSIKVIFSISESKIKKVITEAGFYKLNIVIKPYKKGYIACLEVNCDFNDERLKSIIYHSIIALFGLSKSILKEIDKYNIDLFESLDKAVYSNYSKNIDIATLTEYALLGKKINVIRTFCKNTDLKLINGEPAIYTLYRDVEDIDDFIGYLEQFEKTLIYNGQDKRLFIAVFGYSIENTDLIKKIDFSNRVDRIQKRCNLFEKFNNVNKNLKWEINNLSLITNRTSTLAGGKIYLDSKINELNINKDIQSRLKLLRNVYYNKCKFIKCNIDSCFHFESCKEKKPFSTECLLNGYYEYTEEVKLLTVNQAQKKLKKIVEELKESYFDDYDMAIVKVPTSIGKTTSYIEWIVENTKKRENKDINIIALPTIALANQVKNDLEKRFKEEGIYKNVYCVKSTEVALKNISDELADEYKTLNNIGAYVEASKMLNSLKNELRKKRASEKSQGEKEFEKFYREKEFISSCFDKNGIYIVTHNYLVNQCYQGRLMDKVIVIDEDIFSSINTVKSVRIEDLYKLKELLESYEQTKAVKGTIQIITRTIESFENIVDSADVNAPDIKTRGEVNLTVSLSEIQRGKKESLSSILAKAVKELDCLKDSNVIELFYSEYIMKYRGKILYNVRKNLTDNKYIMFSATADEKIYRKLFTETSRDKLRVKWFDVGYCKSKGKSIQYLNVPSSKAALNRKDIEGVSNAEKIFRTINKECKNPVIITYKNIASKFKLNLEKNMYLGNVSGYNDLIGRDIAVVGNLRACEEVLFLLAKSLNINTDTAGNLANRVVDYGIRRFRAFGYKNSEINHLLLWLAEKETVQACGRNRNRWNNAKTYNFSSIPNPEFEIRDDFILLEDDY